jgi:hypothetical protein
MSFSEIFLWHAKPSLCMSSRTTCGTFEIRVCIFIDNLIFSITMWEKSQNRVSFRGLTIIMQIVYVSHTLGPPSSANYVDGEEFTL